MTKDVFEQAAYEGWRYSTTRGNITTEDLCTLSLDELDTVAKNLNKLVKASEEESFVKKTTPGNKKAAAQLELVKSVIATKLAEQENRKLAADRKAKRERLIELLAKKEDDAMSRKSIASLKAELDKLDDGDEEA